MTRLVQTHCITTSTASANRSSAPSVTPSAIPSASRRHALLSLVAVPLALPAALSAPRAQAAEADLESILPSGAQITNLPKGYIDTTRKLANALIESIELEGTGASEMEVRRKADPVKDLVKNFLADWRDSKIVQGETSYKEIAAALKELGAFYQRNGQRKALTKEVRESVLGHLRAALESLPDEDQKKFLGLF